jgi:hypothetical protein
MSWKTWSPFQSPEVREVCQNLTPAEMKHLAKDAASVGTEIGRRAVPLAAIFGAVVGVMVMATPTWSSSMRGLAIGAGAIVIAPLFLLTNRRWMRENRQRQCEMLCSTEYARANGITPDRLRPFSFSRSPDAKAGNELPAPFDVQTRAR